MCRDQGSRSLKKRIYLIALTLALASLSASFLWYAAGAGSARPAAKKGGSAMPSNKGTWKEVDKLIEEQKFEEAARVAGEIRQRAQAKGDEEEWTRGLVKEVQLRIGLHGYETAVRFLKEQEWPKGDVNRTVLDLFFARSLVIYSQAYSWEIGQREKVESKGPVDLKSWTRGEIYAEALKTYLEVWKNRQVLGLEPAARLSEYMDTNNYPKDVRGTLRDAVSYLFVELLGDTASWTPEQSNEVFRQDLRALMADGAGRDEAMILKDPNSHPLAKICAVLDDLEGWHTREGKREAALEARLERLRRLRSSFTEESDKAAIKADLEKRLPSFRGVPWWSAGQAALAGFVRDEDTPDHLVRARKLAEEGQRAYPDSVGGQMCLSIQKGIEAPDYGVLSMSLDGPGRRSILVNHKNLPAIFFRAYPVDLESRIASARDYNLLPNWQETQKTLKAQKPAISWKVELPPTPDFEMHKTFVTPPIKEPGLYMVAASCREDFAQRENKILGVNFIESDLVILTRDDDAGGVEATVLSGRNGKPVQGAEVSLYRYDWNTGHKRVEAKVTGADGRAVFSYSHERSGGSHFLLAKKGTDISLDSSYLSFYTRGQESDVTASLVYTDRSIYRPTQKLMFKVIAYSSKQNRSRFEILPSRPITVTLQDPNGERVAEQSVTTNAFGTAAGEFAIPTGRLLGNWRLYTSLSGYASVRVEEYKRPTFEATFKDPESPLRLNRRAELKGEVKYYFGLPVVNGSVKWRVTREPVYPWWWGWYWWGGRPPAKAQTVATGTTQLSEEGTFHLSFMPEVDERLKDDKSLSYRYSVTADVTDEGGETRSATRSFRLGFVSVEARADAEQEFFTENAPGEFTVTRSDLNGTPKPGKGTWYVTALAQPEETLLPADQPVLSRPGAKAKEGGLETPGDSLRPRWDFGYEPKAVMRGWKDGAEKGRGQLTHNEKGEAKVALPSSLKPGAYRLHYETLDDFGEKFETAVEFVVAGRHTPLALPAVFIAETGSVPVGGTARFLAHSGLPDQPLYVEIYREGKLSERRRIEAGADASLIEIPILEKDRGGFGVRLTALRDHQIMRFDSEIFVPWDDKELKVEFASFRDKIRPGGKETWRVTVRKPADAAAAKDAPGAVESSAELLAYMYDRSLDIFAHHSPPSPINLYPRRTGMDPARANLGSSYPTYSEDFGFRNIPSAPYLRGDSLKFYDNYGIGGPGMRGRHMYAEGVAGGVMAEMAPMAAPPPAPASAPAKMARKAAAMDAAPAESKEENAALSKDKKGDQPSQAAAGEGEAAPQLRSNFAETAFWQPQLLTGPDGSASIEFTVPDSVTSWNVWVHAVTKDLRSGFIHKETKSVKDLMVRPYIPRFLREGDQAELKVVVNNASEQEMKGTLAFDILDPATNTSLLKDFGIASDGPAKENFTVAPGGGTNLSFRLTAPKRPGGVAFKVTATSGEFSDGELRPLPVLPSRMHLSQSRFVTLKDKERREMVFEDLRRNDDPTLINEQMVVTVDAQLFYQVLEALPYLINYPYECTEQTLNRFVSTGIVTSVFEQYPAVAKMAKEMSKRDTPLETWDSKDPNRKMELEETPWLQEAKGGTDFGFGMTNILDSKVAKAERDASLAKLRKAQTSLGGFPWWPGGPPSPYMTLYIMYGLAKAAEFGVDIPQDMVQRGWQYLARHFREEYATKMVKEDCCWEFLTFLNYTASCYPDPSWTGNALTEKERRDILNHCFKHWKEHSPYLKGLLALTLKRMGRPQDAKLVFDSVMDSSKTEKDMGTFWAQEDRSWLWYNDTIETHAFALRTLMELQPNDSRKDGLVLWLFLNKKLNHWKSTRATAEVIYSLVHYLKQVGALGTREDATVTIGSQRTEFVFEPDKYTGKKNQIVIPGPKVDPATSSTVVVEKESPGYVFASATWSFSTDKLPEEERGDFFQVSRRYFKRENTGKEFVLRPLAEGAQLAPGDEIEIQISLRSKHPAEYVHLRDPRGAGFEPENAVSRYKWDLGIAWYEETRDSGTNFFFEYLPQGEYTFKYRLRANMAGTFRVGPATVQSMYAPEFNAYSSGGILTIKGQ